MIRIYLLYLNVSEISERIGLRAYQLKWNNNAIDSPIRTVFCEFILLYFKTSGCVVL